MTAAHQVLARVIDATHQITEVLLFLAGYKRERQLPRREEPHQPRRVTPIGLHPIPDAFGIDPGAITRRSRPRASAGRASANPVGPAWPKWGDPAVHLASRTLHQRSAVLA
jgi:hypothetical protein